MNNEWRERTIYIFKKMIQMIMVLILLSVIVFVIARLCPGDPLKAYYGDGAEHMSEMQRGGKGKAGPLRLYGGTVRSVGRASL